MEDGWCLESVTKELSGVTNMFFCMHPGGGYVGEYICRNLSRCTIKILCLYSVEILPSCRVSWLENKLCGHYSKETLFSQKPEQTSRFLAVCSAQRVNFFPFSILWAVQCFQGLYTGLSVPTHSPWFYIQVISTSRYILLFAKPFAWSNSCRKDFLFSPLGQSIWWYNPSSCPVFLIFFS